MYVVRWNYKNGEHYIDTGEEIITYDDAIVEFREEADVLIKDVLTDPDTVSVELYDCKKIELPKS